MLPQNVTNNGCMPIPSETPGFILALKVTVSTTCLLSILGASLIIFTYVAFKDLRTTARQLLVNLSVADILVAVSHFAGLHTNYERFLTPCTGYGNLTNLSDPWCATQGGVTMFGSLASFLWTISVAVYLFVVIVVNRAKWAKRLLFVFYPVCWGIPMVIVVAYGIKKFFGFEENVDIAWCFLKRLSSHDKRYIIPEIFGYEMWIFIIFFILPILYIWIRCNVRIKLTRIKGQRSLHLQSKVKFQDLKLIFVPLIFILLRVWDAILAIPLTFMSEEKRVEFRSLKLTAAIVLLSGIGTSAQGLANAILFIVFTRLVRQRLVETAKRILCCRKPSVQVPDSLTTSEVEETTSYQAEIDTPQLIVGVDSSEEPLLSGSRSTSQSYYYSHTSIQRNTIKEE